MMSSEPPSREDVAMRWQAVARGEVAQEVVSKWAEPLMFAKFDPRPDVLVMQALQYLHGRFDLALRRSPVGWPLPARRVRAHSRAGCGRVRCLGRSMRGLRCRPRRLVSRTSPGG